MSFKSNFYKLGYYYKKLVVLLKYSNYGNIRLYWNIFLVKVFQPSVKINCSKFNKILDRETLILSNSNNRIYNERSVVDNFKCNIYLKTLEQINRKYEDYLGSLNKLHFNKRDKVDLKSELNQLKSKRINRLIYKYYRKIYLSLKNVDYKTLMDMRNTQNFVKKFFEFLSKHIGTYKSSLHNIVEGQREVINDENFKFDDGETVKEKVKRFEGRFKENFQIKEYIQSKFKNN